MLSHHCGDHQHGKEPTCLFCKMLQNGTGLLLTSGGIPLDLSKRPLGSHQTFCKRLLGSQRTFWKRQLGSHRTFRNVCWDPSTRFEMSSVISSDVCKRSAEIPTNVSKCLLESQWTFCKRPKEVNNDFSCWKSQVFIITRTNPAPVWHTNPRSTYYTNLRHSGALSRILHFKLPGFVSRYM